MTHRGHLACYPACMRPEYLLALACYLWPDADDTAGRDAARLEAVLAMRRAERESPLVNDINVV